MAEIRKLPGVLLRTAAGAWHVGSGFFFLLRHPRLWPLALIPTLLSLLPLAGFLLGVLFGRNVDAVLSPPRGRLGDGLSLVLTLGLWLGTMVAGAIAGLALALLLAAPLLERLSRRAEAVFTGSVANETATEGILPALRRGMYLALMAPVVFVAGLFPVVGPVLAACLGAGALAHQETAATLARHGLSWQQQRAWHRRWRPESLGFGLAGLLVLAVPGLNLLAPSALAVGATLLALEIGPALESEESVAGMEPQSD